MDNQRTNLFIFERLLKVLQHCSELVHGGLVQGAGEALHDGVEELTGLTTTLEVEPLGQSPLSLWPSQGGVVEPVTVRDFLPRPDQSPSEEEDLVAVENPDRGGVTGVVQTLSQGGEDGTSHLQQIEVLVRINPRHNLVQGVGVVLDHLQQLEDDGADRLPVLLSAAVVHLGQELQYEDGLHGEGEEVHL